MLEEIKALMKCSEVLKEAKSVRLSRLPALTKQIAQYGLDELEKRKKALEADQKGVNEKKLAEELDTAKHAAAKIRADQIKHAHNPSERVMKLLNRYNEALVAWFETALKQEDKEKEDRVTRRLGRLKEAVNGDRKVREDLSKQAEDVADRIAKLTLKLNTYRTAARSLWDIARCIEVLSSVVERQVKQLPRQDSLTLSRKRKLKEVIDVTSPSQSDAKRHKEDA